MDGQSECRRKRRTPTGSEFSDGVSRFATTSVAPGRWGCLFGFLLLFGVNMEAPHALPLAAILFMGAFHGINPGMGWLFAVALGMQERKVGAVWRALIPLTLGHALAIGAVVLLAIVAGVALPAASLKLPAGITLGALGVYRLIRHTHFTGGGMRVGWRGLTAWSFLMASCHGAGLMVLPLFLG